MASKNHNNEEELENGSVSRLLWKLAIPSIVAQLVNLLYNMVDRIFLGRIGDDGAVVLAGLGLALPVITIITSFSYLVGNGGGPLSAIAMGQKNKKEAEKILSNSFVMLIVLSIFLTVILFIFGDGILQLLGADQETLPYASSYLKIYIIGTIFVMLSLGLNPFLIAQGFNKVSLCNTCIGAISNIILDPILIYGFHLGLEGAAIATVISQGISVILILQFLFGKRTKIKIRLVKPEWKIIMKISGLGLSTFFMNLTEGLVQSVFYRQLMIFGNSSYVTAMSIMYSINQFIFMPVQGLGQGAQPIISYNFGAGDEKRLKEATRLLLIGNMIISVVAVTIIELVPGALFSIFTTDKTVISIGIFGIRIFVLGRIITGIQLGLQEMFRAIGYGRTAIYNAAVRKLVLIIPLSLLLPNLWDLGTTGVFLAECIADILAVVNAVISYGILHKGIYRKVMQNKENRKLI